MVSGRCVHGAGRGQAVSLGSPHAACGVRRCWSRRLPANSRKLTLYVVGPILYVTRRVGTNLDLGKTSEVYYDTRQKAEVICTYIYLLMYYLPNMYKWKQ